MAALIACAARRDLASGRHALWSAPERTRASGASVGMSAMTLQRQVLIWVGFLALVVYALVTLSGVLLPFVAGLASATCSTRWLSGSSGSGVNRLGASLVLLALFVARPSC